MSNFPHIAGALNKVLGRAQVDPALIHEEPGPACPRCQGAGILYQFPWRADAPPPPLVPCPDCGAGKEARNRMVQGIIGGSGLEELAAVTFGMTAPSTDQEGPYRFAQNWILDPVGWLWLHGQPRTGKTILAVCLGNAWIASGRRVLFREEPTLMTQLRDAQFGRGKGPSFSEQMDALLTAPLLIVDDFGMARAVIDEEGKSWVDEQRFTITAHRLSRRMPTIVTTNLTRVHLERRFERLAAHVLDNPECTMVPMNAPYRVPKEE